MYVCTIMYYSRSIINAIITNVGRKHENKGQKHTSSHVHKRINKKLIVKWKSNVLEHHEHALAHC